MKILLATSEVVPLAKTGGLADVCGALPVALQQEGHQPTVIMPAYRQALESGLPIEQLDLRFDVPIGGKTVSGEVYRTELADGIPVILVGQSSYFDRNQLYREDGEDYPDNCERFVFFSRAVMELIRLLELKPDIVHCNDWQTGLIPAYLKLEYANTSGYENIASLMTVHNLAYQGVFWHWDMALTGLDWSHFNYHEMEFYGQLNLLKTGLVFADWLTTVSPRYAQEIQTPEHGCGLEGVLQERANVLTGIVNGVDYKKWSPEHDPHLAQSYDVHNWVDSKPVNKLALQRELQLPECARTPLIGVIGRLASQKGWDLLAPVMRHWAHREDVQWAILGTGEPEYHSLVSDLAGSHPERVAVRLEFSERMAHRIEAGADMFVMPSRYEPCGLNQLYSLRYGTVPIVHATGGLADTICDATPATFRYGVANGFSFAPYEEPRLDQALRRASTMYHQPQMGWNKLVENGMKQDWSWRQSARQYIELYETIRRTKGDAC
ncbi:MAG: glycogen synthase GlgA [Planctomycetales bacterium]|nr:glycogen synthase GlgA [Planctomycetales bacterium]